MDETPPESTTPAAPAPDEPAPVAPVADGERVALLGLGTVG
jgi:hypothetical protein